MARRTSREVATATTVLPRRARWRSRDDGVPWRCLPCAPCVDARRARNAQCVAMQRQPVGAPKKKKNVFRSTSRRNTPRKTDGRRRPMPQQIWKGPEIKINDAPPRRLTSAAGAHDAWETARPYLYATTKLLLAANLVYAQMPWHASKCDVSYQRPGRGGRLTTAAPPWATAGRSPGATSGTASAAPGRSHQKTRSPPITP